ncbi:hypothetical protein FRACYDRAFT_278016 [Fragilariopsis cylindrus CCMP1102]|uniref:Uncharacterized protein n=1 Tax=Fragilariopsis cylindrus CCMP1102 TaxID=635003 RepID=A0A1E7EN79_9STRA|nr:hypothetical protein FRACYDRAFT_278016 [Fragilariopsis cylindrus CCMP1102]|eukprot:OEU07023.1 hypothetical protein FRACYDRAFT_278016 [Fragilariopsis cylindrus CCMP1102]
MSGSDSAPLVAAILNDRTVAGLIQENNELKNEIDVLQSIRSFPKMQTTVWPFPPAVVPDSLTGDRGYMLYPNSIEVLAAYDNTFASRFDEDPILQTVLFHLGRKTAEQYDGNDMFDSFKFTLKQALVTRAKYAVALYMAFVYKLKQAQINGEKETFVTIEIDRNRVLEEMYNTSGILSNYKKVMSPDLDKYMKVISPLKFEATVEEIIKAHNFNK